MPRTTVTRAPAPWFGGKQAQSAYIANLMPAHTTYVEVFGGMGAVFFAKRPSQIEIYNDIDDRVVTFFRALRNDPLALVNALELTPYAPGGMACMLSGSRRARAR